MTDHSTQQESGSHVQYLCTPLRGQYNTRVPHDMPRDIADSRPHGCLEQTQDRDSPGSPPEKQTAGTDLRRNSVLEDNACAMRATAGRQSIS